MASPDSTNDALLVRGALAANVVFLVAAVVVYLLSKSQLVLAQGADSLMDVAAGAILTYSVAVGQKPRDENHPFGHQRAEPIGALITAVLAGVLGFTVLRSGIVALVAKEHAALDLTVAALLGAKLLSKVVLLIAIARNQTNNPAVHAARVDARNDVMACASSLVGVGLYYAGWVWADAALALPVGVYITYNGINLARDNLRFLMGAAPADAVLQKLRTTAEAVSGVLSVSGLRAQYLGPDLHVEVSIVVSGDQTVTQGHDISVDVQHRLEALEEVGEVFVHVDTDLAKPHG